MTGQHESTVPPIARKPERRGGAGLLIGGVVLLIVSAGAGLLLSSRRNASSNADASARTADVDAGPIVRAEPVQAAPATRTLSLLGEARPYASVTLYAKLSGYLKRMNVDRGDRVRAGQVLAEIESPETDQAYLGAKADADNKAAIARRLEQLLTQKFVSTQEAEQARTDASVAKQRLQVLEGERQYESIRAPFDGTVTARFADPGALIQNAASSQTAALPLVSVAQTERLRVLLYIDQRDAAALRPGVPARVMIPERPEVSIAATVTRVSGDIDPRTRKLLAEVELPNPDQRIVSGSFVRVELTVPQPVRVRAPVEALVVKKSKTFVAVLGADSTMHLHPVDIVDNDGQVVDFTSDITPGTQVLLNVGDVLADGARVRPVTGKTPAGAAPPPAGAKPSSGGAKP